MKLDVTDAHCLRAALGWLELGSPKEARLEMKQLSEAAQAHPDVLEIRWAVCAGEKNWKEALVCADQLVENHPERASGWIHRAYALRRVGSGGLEAAWNVLLKAVEMFPGESVIPYNLACYAAQFGRLNDAWDWLHKAMAAADNVEQIKSMALADEDLKELWERIRAL